MKLLDTILSVFSLDIWIMSALNQIDRNNVPKHVAIIMDGNGRWAKMQGHDRLFGHEFGVESVRESLKAAQELGVEHLTLYAFSTENWRRPKEEVEGLMDLLVRTISKEVEELDRNNVQITTIGDLDGLPGSCKDEMMSAVQRTRSNTGVNLILALNYSGRTELLRAVKKMIDDNQNGDSITEESISEYLYTTNIPDPELIVRTSGEHRLSNFLLWQAAYAEFYFTEVLWPDFKAEDFYDAILNYQSRERRFGMVSEQIL